MRPPPSDFGALIVSPSDVFLDFLLETAPQQGPSEELVLYMWFVHPEAAMFSGLWSQHMG